MVCRSVEEPPDDVGKCEGAGDDDADHERDIPLWRERGEDHVAELHMQQIERVCDASGGQHRLRW